MFPHLSVRGGGEVDGEFAGNTVGAVEEHGFARAFISRDQRLDGVHVCILAAIAIEAGKALVPLIGIGAVRGLVEMRLHEMPAPVEHFSGAFDADTRRPGCCKNHKGMAIGHCPAVLHDVAAALP